MRVRARMGAGVFSGLVLLIFFNNCNGQVRFGGSGGFTSTRLDSGNGGGYGGKPDGTFYHLVPEFSCERQEAAMGIMAISTAGVTYVENSRLQCDAARTDIDPDLIDASPFHNQLVGYQDMIFERKDTEVTKIPDRLVEAWCFDDPVEKNLEIIAQYDRVTRRATSTVYRRSSGTKVDLVSGIAVSRLVTIDSVHYQGAQYDLVVDKTSPARIVGQFNGQFKGAVAGQTLDIGVNCRLGGYLDARLWPAKALSTEVVHEYTYYRVPDQVFVRSRTPAGKLRLSRLDLPQLTETPMTPLNPPFAGVNSFKVDRDKNLALLAYDGLGPYLYRLYSMNLTDFSMTVLSDTISSSLQFVHTDYETSKDGKMAFYKDGAQEPDSNDVEQWLRVVPTDGSAAPTQLNHNLPIEGGFSVFDFAFSKDLGRLAYLTSSMDEAGRYEIWSVREDGTNDIRISPDVPSTTIVLYGGPLKLIGTGRHSVLYAAADRSVPAITKGLTMISRLDGSGSTVLNGYLAGQSGTDNSRGYLHPETEIADPRLLFFSNQHDDGGFLYDADTGRSLATPFFHKLFFPRNSTQMIGVRGGEVHLVDVATNENRQVCTVSGIPTVLAQSHQDVVMAVWTSNEIVLYRIADTECQVINAIPGRAHIDSIWRPWSPSLLVIAPDENSVAIVYDFNGDSGLDLVWVPLDGRAPVKINHPLELTQSVYSVHYTSDSSGLVFYGDLITKDSPMLFLWKIPK